MFDEIFKGPLIVSERQPGMFAEALTAFKSNGEYNITN